MNSRTVHSMDLVDAFFLLMWALVTVMPQSAASGEMLPIKSLGAPPGGSSAPQGQRTDCGTLLFNADETYENAYAWEYQGVQEPYYGAFAECYSGAGEACAAVFDLTTVYDYHPEWIWMDIYIWDDDGGIPGPVLLFLSGFDPGDIARWPEISRHTVALPANCLEDDWWVGQWGNWVFYVSQWFVAADLNGPGGCPMTNIAPGIGYPTGWHDPSVVWQEEAAALGIGVEIRECPPVPVGESSWGRIKSLFCTPR